MYSSIDQVPITKIYGLYIENKNSNNGPSIFQEEFNNVSL